jgi:nucleoside 2-deoxyribosyltransferase
MNEKKCFVIMPFAGTTEKHSEQYWTEFFEKFLKPEMESIGYSCERSKAAPDSIIQSIIRQLNNSDIVLAVLTDFNANVWYELGIRHTLKRGTIMLIEEGHKLPFDISQYGVLHYSDKLSAGENFKERLKQFCEKNELERKADNPVQTFLESENLIVNKDEAKSINELLHGINWAELPISQLAHFHEAKFHFYIINSDSKKVMDVAGSSKKDGGKIHLWKQHEFDNQVWEIRHRYGDIYTISSKISGKCLEAQSGLEVNSTPIQQNEFKNLRNQLWKIIRNEDKSYRIILSSGDKCIEADAQTVHEDGGRIILHDYNSGSHQNWILQPIPITFK